MVELTAHFKLQVSAFILGIIMLGIGLLPFVLGLKIPYFADSFVFYIVAGAIFIIGSLGWFFYEVYDENTNNSR